MTTTRHQQPMRARPMLASVINLAKVHITSLKFGEIQVFLPKLENRMFVLLELLKTVDLLP
jgi:hypothetical protein